MNRENFWCPGRALLAALVICVFVGLLTTGCNLANQHAQMMDAMRGAMSDTASRLSQSGTGQIAAGGQVINPGIRVRGGVEYFAEAAYVGVAGQVQASMMGLLDRPLPEEVQQRCNLIWANTAMSDKEKWNAFVEVLRSWMAKPKANQPASAE